LPPSLHSRRIAGTLSIPTSAVISLCRCADSPGAVVGIVEIGLAGFCLVKGIAMLRRRLLRWHQEAQEVATVQPTARQGRRPTAGEEGRRPRMHPQFLTRARKRKIAAALTVLGIFLWLTAVMLHVGPADARDVTFPHMEARLLGIVAGGASVAGGIVLFAAA
jgi:hypothetical protein